MEHSLFAHSLISANEEGGTALLPALLCWKFVLEQFTAPPIQGRSINFPHILITMSTSGECCEIGYYQSPRQVFAQNIAAISYEKLAFNRVTSTA